MAFIEDRWYKSKSGLESVPTSACGVGLQFRVRWTDGDGKEVSRSFGDRARAVAFLDIINQRACVTAAEAAEGLCHVHAAQLTRLELHDLCLRTHRLRSCVMPVQVPYRRIPEGTTLLCGKSARRDIEGAPFCDEHYALLDAWRETRADELGDIDPDWVLGWEATGRQVVYYVRRESDGLIKIGTSGSLNSRLAALRAEHGPLRLLLTHVGDRGREQNLHLAFTDWFAFGEWFHPGDKLLAWIAEARRRPANIRTALPRTEPLEFILGLDPAPAIDWVALTAAERADPAA
jgi:hypothetical protein